MGTLPTVYTIGHSNHACDAFLGLLKTHEIDTLVDVRSRPYSRWTHFNQNSLSGYLDYAGIKYLWAGRTFGGHGGPSVAALMFVEQMQALIARAEHGQRVTLMCSEGKPVQCHRAMKLTAWLHRHAADRVRTAHILPDCSLADAVALEADQKPKWLWHEFGGEFGKPKSDLVVK